MKFTRVEALAALDIAIPTVAKAHTVLNTSNPTSAGLLQLEKITTVEGALPIFAGPDLVGAIGISGAPGGDKDAACGQPPSRVEGQGIRKGNAERKCR